jgi:hypothetical protein
MAGFDVLQHYDNAHELIVAKAERLVSQLELADHFAPLRRRSGSASMSCSAGIARRREPAPTDRQRLQEQAL